MYRKRDFDNDDDYSELKEEERAMMRAAKARRLEAVPWHLGGSVEAGFFPPSQHSFDGSSNAMAASAAEETKTMMRGATTMPTGIGQLSSSAAASPSTGTGVGMGSYGIFLAGLGGAPMGESSSMRGGLSMETLNFLNRSTQSSSLHLPNRGLGFGGQSSLGGNGNATSADHGFNLFLMQNSQTASNLTPSSNLYQMQPTSLTSMLQHQTSNEGGVFQPSAFARSARQQQSLSLLRQPLFLQESLLMQQHEQQQQQQQRQLQLEQQQQELYLQQQQFLPELDISTLLTSQAGSSTNNTHQISASLLLQKQQQQQLNMLDPALLLNSGIMSMQRGYHQHQSISMLNNIPTPALDQGSNMSFNNMYSQRGSFPSLNLPNMMNKANVTTGSHGTNLDDDEHDIPPPPILSREYGRAKPMSTSDDEKSLSAFQFFAREQIEFFEAVASDVSQGARGRNVPITLGQVGIRCKHCRNDGPNMRGRAGVYFPTKYELVYQTAVNMTSIHLCQQCTKIPKEVRARLLELRDQRSTPGGGKIYWAKSSKSIGVIETTQGLRFQD